MKVSTKILLTAGMAGVVALLLWPQRQHPASVVVSAAKVAGAINLRSLSVTNPVPPVVSGTAALQPGLARLLDDAADYPARLQSATKLASIRLSTSDRDAVYGLLRKRMAIDEDQRGHVFKNEVMDRLCEMKPLPEGLGRLLADIYNDSGQHPVIRDYAIQHLAEFHSQLLKDATMDPADKSAELAQAREVLWSAAGENNTSIAGTALLGLLYLSTQTTEVNPVQIGVVALRLTKDSSANELVQITAFQVCGRLGVSDAYEPMLQAAQSNRSMPLRISAVGALGALGNPKAVPFLTQLASGNEMRLTLPATRALEQISARAGVGK